MDRTLAPLRCDTRYYERRSAWGRGIRSRALAKRERALQRAGTARGAVLAMKTYVSWSIADLIHPRRNITITFTIEDANHG